MIPSPRVIKDLLTVIPVLALFLLVSVNPLAQSLKLQAPSTHVSDSAGVIDPRARVRVEGLLQRLKEKSKIELYVATVETTGEQRISDFSQQLARDWNIGVKTSPSRTLLMVVSVGSKTSFTQFSRAAQLVLPEGVLGEMSYRMQGPLSEGRFTEAIESGIQVFVNAVAEKFAFNVAELESPAVASGSPERATDSSQPVLVAVSDAQQTRPRTVTDGPKAQPEATPPAEEPKPADTPTPEAVASETPKSDPVLEDLPKPTVTPAEPPKETPNTSNTTRRKASATTRVAPVRKKTAAEIAEEDADESEEVELTLTLPLDRRAVALQEFLDALPKSKSRPRAIELLIMTHVALGDQKLKNGDSVGGIESLTRAIEAADANIPHELFSGTIAQIPMNLYLRGERDAAFKMAQLMEARFANDPKRLLAVAGFYMGIERATETIRIAETAVKLAPDLGEAHRMLAVGHLISLRLDDAIAEYRRSLDLEPGSKAARGSLADLYRAAGKPEEALAFYNEQLDANPKDRSAQAGKVIALFELGRTDEANTALAAALADEPRNLPLLAGAAYWLAAHGNNERAYELAQRAVDVESRYPWAQVALARSLVALERPIEAERAIRTARRYGKFPTLTYELANVLASMGFYEEAADALRESFTIKDDHVHTLLAGHVPASEPGFLELLARERRAGFYQPTAADTEANAKTLKALLAFHTALTPAAGEKINEAATVAAREFASGNDNMRAFRQVYAASRLLRHGVGLDTVLELIAEAKNSSSDALKVSSLTTAVQADEYRDLRARSIAAGSVPDVGVAPPEVMAKILKGRLEDLHGWTLFNQEKYTDSIPHLKEAAEILPLETPAWRTALWHLGAALEQTGEKEQALDAYIKSYRSGPVENVRRAEIERLYQSINGSLDGIEERIAGVTNTTRAAAVSSSPEAPEATPEATPEAKPEAAPEAPAPSSDKPAPELSEEELRSAALRLRANIKISGRIVDSANAGLANVVVVLISPSGAVIASTTDKDGNYSFKVAPSQKTYRVIPSRDGYSFTPVDRTFTGLIDDEKEINFVGSRF